MDLYLSEKCALVTGSTSGLGEQIAKTLAAGGASVIVHGRRGAEAQRVVKEIVEPGGRTAVAIGDQLRDQGGGTVVAAEGGWQGFGGTSGLGDFAHGRVGTFTVGTMMDDDVRTFPGKTKRDGGADAAGSTGNEDKFVFEQEVHGAAAVFRTA